MVFGGSLHGRIAGAEVGRNKTSSSTDLRPPWTVVPGYQTLLVALRSLQCVIVSFVTMRFVLSLKSLLPSILGISSVLGAGE